jgi:predicted mannosyl-3-phosphoglycerate phosphatase (HAD superfamily)
MSLRPSQTVVFCAIDSLISISNQAVTGFTEFLEGLEEAEIPCVWVSARNRMFLDATIRKFGQSAPFIAEGGCGVYLPEDYFHLKPPKTTRLGRFTCVPAAKLQPAAKDALDEMADETGVSLVPLRSLRPKELSQNVGLPQGEAELLRQRDFDELFFFAGATSEEIQKFKRVAVEKKLSLLEQGILWSLAEGRDLKACVRELGKLYDRALRAPALRIAVGTEEDGRELFGACNRTILLTERASEKEEAATKQGGAKNVALFGPETWRRVLEIVENRGH